MKHPLQFDHPFVHFAQDVTKNLLVKEALMRLQLQHALNINLILYGLWYGLNQRGRLLKQDIKALLQSIHPWHERVLLALKRLGDRLPALHELIHTEIQTAENIERQLIADTLFKLNFQKRNPAQQLSDACHNVANYYKIMNTHVDPQDQQAIIDLLQAAFPNLIAAEITDACESSLGPAASQPSGHYSQLPLGDL